MNLLVSDFDKTLYDDNYLNNIKAVNEYVENDNMFVIATGRTLEQLLNVIKDNNINYSYLICNDGSVIYDKDFNIVKYFPIINSNLFIEDFNNLKTIDMKQTTTINDEVVSAKGHIIDFKNIKDEFFGLIAKYPNIRGSLSDTWCQITSNKTNKSYAVKEISKLYNFNNIYTIGDNDNDIDMLLDFNGYKVKNCSRYLKNIKLKEIETIEDLVKVI